MQDKAVLDSGAKLDLLWGAMEIGAVIRCPPRKTYYLLEKGLIPARKVGDSWVSSRTALQDAFRDLRKAPEAV
jgi:hypothetical protein